jgi:hypothetical protein
MHVENSSGGNSHTFTFVGFNATNEELGLCSINFYYIPCNVSKDMDDSAIQEDFYRNTLLDPDLDDVSAGIVFASAKDPQYAAVTMPGKSTAFVFLEAKDTDFLHLSFICSQKKMYRQHYVRELVKDIRIDPRHTMRQKNLAACEIEPKKWVASKNPFMFCYPERSAPASTVVYLVSRKYV